MALKEIRAIVRPSRLFRLRETMRAIPDFPGMTVLNVRGFTAPGTLVPRSTKDELMDFSDKLMVIVLSEEEMVPTIRAAIIKACVSGQVGDGLIWVVNVDSAERIRDADVTLV